MPPSAPAMKSTRRGWLALAVLVSVGGCAPTVHVKIDPITINAKLDADVRIRLDKEVQQEIQQNPNLF
ncbi:MAG TPA: YnbE family lipoprotein [Caulobacteraceae bacterium]|nr:YnbE family lipoprotein [Caulobacteraceae bacterium]